MNAYFRSHRFAQILCFVALCALLFMAFPGTANAAQPNTVNSPQISDGGDPRQATLTWTAPATYIDGSPITEPITYNVYEGLCSLTTLPKVLGPITGLGVTRINQPIGAMCYQITAQTPNGGESARTNRGSKTFPWPAPNTAPTLAVD